MSQQPNEQAQLEARAKSEEVMAQLKFRAEYLQHINHGLASSIRSLKASVLLASTANEVFPDAAKMFEQELLEMVQMLRGGK